LRDRDISKCKCMLLIHHRISLVPVGLGFSWCWGILRFVIMSQRPTPTIVMPAPQMARSLQLPLGLTTSTPTFIPPQSPMQTPMNVPSTNWRTIQTPGAPERRGLRIQTGESSPMISYTPIHFRPPSVGSQSLPLRGPLHGRFPASNDCTPAMSTHTRKLSGVCSLDITPIMRERSFSAMSLDGEWTGTSSIDNARFLDSQPCTPLSACAPVTPMATGSKRNAFGMETLEESPFLQSAEKSEQGQPYSPPASALVGGA